MIINQPEPCRQNNSAGSATAANVSGTAESREIAEEPAPSPFVNIATFRGTNLLPPSYRIAESEVLALRREAATKELQLTIRDLDVRNPPLLFSLDVAWARFPNLEITWYMLENHIAARQQSSKEKPCLLSIMLVHLENNRRARGAVVANQQGPFQVPATVSCMFFDIPDFIETLFVDNLARWLLAQEAFGLNPAFTDFVDLWRARVPTYNDDLLVRGHDYEHVVASRLGPAIGTENKRVLMQEGTCAAREKLRCLLISSVAALYASLDAFRAVPQTFRFRLFSAFAILPICTIHYFAEAVQDCVDELGDITFETPFFHYSSVGNITLSHRRSCDCICCQVASAIVGRVY